MRKGYSFSCLFSGSYPFGFSCWRRSSRFVCSNSPAGEFVFPEDLLATISINVSDIQGVATVTVQLICNWCKGFVGKQLLKFIKGYRNNQAGLVLLWSQQAVSSLWQISSSATDARLQWLNFIKGSRDNEAGLVLLSEATDCDSSSHLQLMKGFFGMQWVKGSRDNEACSPRVLF